MDNQSHNQIVSFIWGIADDCLRDVYVRGKYRDVILPMTVIRRLDAVLEDTKDEVLKMKKMLDDAKISDQADALCKAAGQSFCNSSLFKLRDIPARGKLQQMKADFIAYLDGFSPNVQEILEKFKFRNQIDTMVDADILGAIIEKFVSKDINLSPNPVLDDKGEVKLPALDNHTMGVIFEELIRRFNEENNEEAGEHFTPRDVVELMADLIFVPVADKIKDSTYSVYDGASGTGGMLTVAQERLDKLAEKYNKKVSVHLFGQEINPETYAITKADMLIKGNGEEAEHIAFGSTLSNDGFPTHQFDFMLSNPPYGKSWKVDADKLGGKKDILDSRFNATIGDEDVSMIPRTSDGQLLFLLNNISKMKTATPLGSRIAEVHNGSSLFTGDAGQGESNARRYMIENDMVEAIVALPDNMFYNTGIGTFIWILSNKKEDKRKGKIQLIDATSMKSPLRKNLGKKNCEISSHIRHEIVRMYIEMEESECSKIFNNKDFGYWKVTVCRPLRYSFSLTEDNIYWIPSIQTDKSQTWSWSDLEYNGKRMPERIIGLRNDLLKLTSDKIYYTKEDFLKVVEPIFDKYKLSVREINILLYNVFEEKNSNGEIYTDNKGNIKADSDLTDTEQIPFTYEGGIEAFFENEIKPFATDAWIDEKATKIGYELSFTKYFYKPVELRPLEEIVSDIRKIEAETDGMLAEIIGG